MIEEISNYNFIKLPEIMLNNSKNAKYIQLLSDSIIKYYYYTDLKKDIVNIFRKFVYSKYLITKKDNFNLKSNTNSFEVLTKSNTINDKVGDYIEKKIDLNIWSKDLYNILVCLSSRLTYEETTYLISSFFESKSEEEISEKLGICRKTLYKIKKSCLVKIKLEFDKYNFM